MLFLFKLTNTGIKYAFVIMSFESKLRYNFLNLNDVITFQAIFMINQMVLNSGLFFFFFGFFLPLPNINLKKQYCRVQLLRFMLKKEIGEVVGWF